MHISMSAWLNIWSHNGYVAAASLVFVDDMVGGGGVARGNEVWDTVGARVTSGWGGGKAQGDLWGVYRGVGSGGE